MHVIEKREKKLDTIMTAYTQELKIQVIYVRKCHAEKVEPFFILMRFKYKCMKKKWKN